MNADLAALLYLVSGVLFILALRGLSSPETSRQGNMFGMLGMALAIGVTLLLIELDGTTLGIILAGVVIGGGVGAVIARQIKMTAMPQLVAAFHSLVGLAAVAVACAAFYAPESFGIAEGGHIHLQSLIELSLGAAIGAITFTGSVIAFAKLNGNMSGAPIILPARHLINIASAQHRILIVLMVQSGRHGDMAFLGACRALAADRHNAHHPDRRGDACRRLDAELVLRLGGGRARLHAGKHRADHHRRAGRLLGRDPQLHHARA